MKNLLSIVAIAIVTLCATQSGAQTNTPNFYLLSHPEWPPIPFTPDPLLPSYTNEVGVFVDDSWLELGRALMSSMDFPDPPGEGGSSGDITPSVTVTNRPEIIWFATNYYAAVLLTNRTALESVRGDLHEFETDRAPHWRRFGTNFLRALAEFEFGVTNGH